MANLFLQDIRQFIPSDRIYTDELRTLGWGTDASFYRQIPKVVIRSDGEEEISKIVKSHPEFLKKIEVLRDKVRADKPLAARIRTKYNIKNVTGLNLRPLIAYDDPFDIIAQHRYPLYEYRLSR